MARWDKKYRNGHHERATRPHDLIQKFWQTVPGKKATDVVMVNGRKR